MIRFQLGCSGSMRRYGETCAIGSIFGGIFICGLEERLRGPNSDFGHQHHRELTGRDQRPTQICVDVGKKRGIKTRHVQEKPPPLSIRREAGRSEFPIWWYRAVPKDAVASCTSR